MEEKTAGVWSWLLSIILFLIPAINIIYLLVLVFGQSKYRAKVNFARAFILLLLIVVVAYFVTFAVKYYINNNAFNFDGYINSVKTNLTFVWGKVVDICKSIWETAKQ